MHKKTENTDSYTFNPLNHGGGGINDIHHLIFESDICSILAISFDNKKPEITLQIHI